MRGMARALVAGLLCVLAVGVVAPTASAHERRQVGNYVVVVGFDTEPTFVEELNGASITVFGTDGKAVDGVDKTLKVEVSAGGTSRTFDLRPVPGKAGAYHAEFIPTKTGSYTFRFFGKIGDQDFNEKFESGPNRFDEVVGKSDLEFPVTVPSNGELAAGLRGGAPAPAASAAPASSSTTSSAEAQRALDRADSARSTAIAFGIIGVLVGLLGVGMGGYALLARGRNASTGSGGHTGEPI